MTIHHHPNEMTGYLHQSPTHVRLLLAGHRHVSEWRPSMVVARPHLLLTFIDSGFGIVEDQTQHRLKPGHWYVVFPDEVVRVYTDRDKPMCCWWMGIEGDDALSVMRHAELSDQQRVRKANQPRKTRKLFAELIQHIADDNPASLLSANGCMWQMLAQLTGKHSASSSASSLSHEHHAVQQACQIMQHQYVTDINAAQVALIIGMDRSYLSSLFSQAMGITMRDYLLSLRISRAQLLLRHSDLTVQQIAQAVGYTEYRSFIRAFRQKTTKTPRQYADQSRGKNR